MARKIRFMKYVFCVFVSYLVLRCFVLVFSYAFQPRTIKEFCGGNFTGYENKFAKLVNVVIDPTKSIGKVGGEKISDVINQTEESEFFRFSYGYFELMCNESVSYRFRKDVHLSKWIKVLKLTRRLSPHIPTIKGWTIAVTRFEYANFYHTITDYYNTFLLMKKFNISVRNVTILLIDGHPAGILDETWSVLFGNVVRVGVFQKPIRFQNLLWGISGYDSSMKVHTRMKLPLVNEFKRFFLDQHHVTTDNALNCNMLNILIIFRRNYIAHPRNPSGSVSRKIKNENELIDAITDILPGHINIHGLQLDLLTMREQLLLVSNTDILIGMHGAGLSHVLFLPQHAGVVELFPIYWYDIHFQAFARWRNLKYASWKNTDYEKELPDHYTVVDVDAVAKLVLNMKKDICRHVQSK